MQPIALLQAILIIQSACIIFILIERADVTAKVAHEIIPFMSDISRSADATRIICGRRATRTRMNASEELHFLTPFTEITTGIQRSEALALYSLVKLIVPKNILLISYHQNIAKTLLAAVPWTTSVTAVASEPSLPATELLRTYPNFKFSSAGAHYFMPSGRYDFIYITAPTTRHAFLRIPLSPLNCIIAVHGTGLHTLYPPPANGTDAAEAILAERSPPEAITTNKGPGVPHNPSALEFAQWVAEQLKWEAFHIMSTRAWRHGLTLIQEKHRVEEEDY